MVINFADFLSSVSSSATIEKKTRLCTVQTGMTQNSVGKVYSELPQAGDYWNCVNDLELAFHYYIGEFWLSGDQHGAEVYIKYGMGTDADTGAVTDKCFGIKLEDLANEKIKATGFVRNGATLKTDVLSEVLEVTVDYVFTIKKVGGTWTFYIDGVELGSISETLSGTVGDPYLTHVCKNPVNGSAGGGILNTVGYYFPY